LTHITVTFALLALGFFSCYAYAFADSFSKTGKRGMLILNVIGAVGKLKNLKNPTLDD
jgi:hypothetical protein